MDIISRAAEYFTHMTPVETVGQVIGFIGMAMLFISFQQKENKKIYFWQIIGVSLFTVHFAMLGAYTGALLNILGVLRAVVFYNSEKKWAQSKLWVYGLLAAYVVVGILIWEDRYSLLPILAMVLSTFAFTADTPFHFRLLSFPCSPMWLTYNIHHFSISGSIAECCSMTSMIIAFIRCDLMKAIHERKDRKS